MLRFRRRLPVAFVVVLALLSFNAPAQVCPPPSVGISASGPDEDGGVIVSIPYTIPDTDCSLDAYACAVQFTSTNSPGAGSSTWYYRIGNSGTLTIPINEACKRDTMTYKAWVGSCGESREATTQLSIYTPDPTASVSYEVVPDGAVFFNVDYTLPMASGGMVFLYVDGIPYQSWYGLNTKEGSLRSWGSTAYVCDQTPHEVRAVARSCSGYEGEMTTTFSGRKPEVKTDLVVLGLEGNQLKIRVDYEFRYTISSSQRKIYLEWLPTGTEPAIVMGPYGAGSWTGSETYYVDNKPGRVLQARGEACADGQGKEDPFSQNTCSLPPAVNDGSPKCPDNCVGDPVNRR